jgi:uncharacterized repeat protein (TIGR03803 family)
MKKLLLIICAVFIGHAVNAQSQLWGMASQGGLSGAGAIFKTDGSGDNQTVQQDYFQINGGYPGLSLMQATDGKLYGLSYLGGSNNTGVLYQYDPVTSIYTTLFDFNTSANGIRPQGALLQASNGIFYGMTEAGGTFGYGVLFQFDPVTLIYTKILNFDGATNGRAPQGNLIQATDGNLYGTTPLGGTNNMGVLFQYNPTTSIYTKKLDFDLTTSGRTPGRSLMQAIDGKLYGMTNLGGANNMGVIFEYNFVTSVFAIRMHFAGTTNGSRPSGGLMQASDGMLYGMTQLGGTYNKGTLFQFNPVNSAYVRKLDFDGTGNGLHPYGNLIQATNGYLYAMTYQGGTNSAGIIYKYNLTTSLYTKIFEFDWISTGLNPLGSLFQASDGNLYGVNGNGATSNVGALFRFDPVTETYLKIYSFSSTPSIPGLNGSNPYGALIQATDGKLYGMATYGGVSSKGVLFRVDPPTSAYTKMVEFSGTANGSHPSGSLLEASDGNFYGMTSTGGVNGLGVLFQFNPVTSVYTKLLDFDGVAKGSNPYGSLMQAANGNLYGMTSAGGTNSLGVLFQFDPVTSVYTKLLDFDGAAKGSNPIGSLMQATDGNLYGMTSEGGVNALGVLFQFNPATAVYTKLLDFAGTTNGSTPAGGLTQASNGNLYGLTSEGGANALGVLFQYDLTTSSYTSLLDFDGVAKGSNPVSTLKQALDGNLYGVTKTGGINNLGVIFQYNPGTSTYTKKLDFNGANGSTPFYNNLVEIPVSITTSPVTLVNCGGAAISVPYTIAGGYNPGNIFTAQLSDATGSFAAPVTIGTLTSTGPGSIPAILPPASLQGNAYRIRVVSSSPVIIGTDNGSNILINALPAVTATASDSTICRFDSTQLSSSNANTYVWNPGALSSSSAWVFPYNTTTYTVTGTTTATGCSKTATVTITVHTLPNVLVSAAPSTVCANAPTILTASGALTYSWVTGNLTGTSVSYSPIANTTYSVVGTNVNGCTDTGSVAITVTPGPTVSASASSYSFCAGASTTLTATGGLTYTWMPGALTGSSIVISPTSSITYTVTGNSANGCTDTATVAIIVNPLPTVSYTASPATTVCTGTSVTLNGTGAATYSWSGGILDGVPFVPASSYTYTVTGTDANGCTGNDVATIIVNPLPTIGYVASPTTAVCAGAFITLSGTGGATYSWTGGIMDGLPFAAAATTSYTVTGTDANGCSNTSSVTITVNASPVAVQGVLITSGCNVSTGSATASITSGNGPFVYEWLPGNIASFTANNIPSGSYTFVVTDANSCVDSLTVAVGDSCDYVWPGDANQDGIADNADILSIGIANAATGTTRASATLSWIGQPAADWGQTFLSGTDYKFADCDGDGTIQPVDTNAVILNFGFTHVFREGPVPAYNASLPDLTISMGQDTVAANAQGTMTISLGNALTPASNLYGLAFTINFDPAQVDAATFRMNENGTWMGIPGSNLMGVVMNSGTGTGSVQVAITRLDQTDANGFGDIANLSFITTNALASTGNAQQVNFTITDLTAISANETPLLFNMIGDSVLVIDPLVTGISSNENLQFFSIYPNPFDASTQIILPETIYGKQNEIILTDLEGRIVRIENCSDSNTFTLHRGDLDAGMYFCTIRSEGKVIDVTKVMVK